VVRGARSSLKLTAAAPSSENFAFRTYTDNKTRQFAAIIAAFPILADPVDVKKSYQLCKTVSQPSIPPDKVDPPMGS